MLTAKALREERKKLVDQARKNILEKAEAEGRDLSAEEQEQWARVMGGVGPDGKTVRGQVDVLKDRIDRLEAVERLDADFGAPTGDPRIGREPIEVRVAGGDGAVTAVTEEHRVLALQAWIRHQAGKPLDEEHLEALKVTGLNPATRELSLRLYKTDDYAALQRRFRQSHPARALENVSDFKATLSGKSGPAGAYLIPPETLIRTLEINMLAFGGVRQVAETIRTGSGERMSWPTADDTSNTGVQLEESTTIGSSVDPTFNKVFWDAYKFSSKPVLIPYELMQDSAFNLAGMLGEMLGVRLGRITNTKFTTGTGANTCKGIVTAASTGVTAASATAIAADELFGLVHSIDPAYRNGAGWMFHDSILLYLRKLKDGEGRYLWQSGMNGGSPDTLLTYPTTINQDMQSSVATGTKTILFGQLRNYKIRTVGEVRLYHLVERYRDTDQDAFIAFTREDGNLLTAGTAPVKALLQA